MRCACENIFTPVCNALQPCQHTPVQVLSHKTASSLQGYTGYEYGRGVEHEQWVLSINSSDPCYLACVYTMVNQTLNYIVWTPYYGDISYRSHTYERCC